MFISLKYVYKIYCISYVKYSARFITISEGGGVSLAIHQKSLVHFFIDFLLLEALITLLGLLQQRWLQLFDKQLIEVTGSPVNVGLQVVDLAQQLVDPGAHQGRDVLHVISN